MVYYRLHGSPRMYYSNYTNEFLETLQTTLREEVERGRDAWCIFDNTGEYAAQDNALTVEEGLRRTSGDRSGVGARQVEESEVEEETDGGCAGLLAVGVVAGPRRRGLVAGG